MSVGMDYVTGGRSVTEMDSGAVLLGPTELDPAPSPFPRRSPVTDGLPARMGSEGQARLKPRSASGEGVVKYISDAYDDICYDVR